MRKVHSFARSDRLHEREGSGERTAFISSVEEISPLLIREEENKEDSDEIDIIMLLYAQCKIND